MVREISNSTRKTRYTDLVLIRILPEVYCSKPSRRTARLYPWGACLGEYYAAQTNLTFAYMCQFAVPFLTATTMGLSALALESNPVFPTYPNRMNPADVSAGLVLPDAAVALLGKGGAIATLLIVFFAVTSALSSERKLLRFWKRMC
jgi:hypothetical protein